VGRGNRPGLERVGGTGRTGVELHVHVSVDSTGNDEAVRGIYRLHVESRRGLTTIKDGLDSFTVHQHIGLSSIRRRHHGSIGDECAHGHSVSVNRVSTGARQIP